VDLQRVTNEIVVTSVAVVMNPLWSARVAVRTAGTRVFEMPDTKVSEMHGAIRRRAGVALCVSMEVSSA